MEMWNWLLDCYDEGSLDMDELEQVMEDDAAAGLLWNDFVSDSGDFVSWVRDEVEEFIEYLDEKKRSER